MMRKITLVEKCDDKHVQGAKDKLGQFLDQGI